MAQTMHCENTEHTEPTEGFVMLQFLGTPDTQVTCVPCWEEWCWAFIEALPTFEDRIKTYMGIMLEAQEATRKQAAKPARKRAAGKAPAKDTDAEIATGESTSDGQ